MSTLDIISGLRVIREKIAHDPDACALLQSAAALLTSWEVGAAGEAEAAEATASAHLS